MNAICGRISVMTYLYNLSSLFSMFCFSVWYPIPPPPSISWIPLEKGAKTNGSGFFSWKYLAKLNFPQHETLEGGGCLATHCTEITTYPTAKTKRPIAMVEHRKPSGRNELNLNEAMLRNVFESKTYSKGPMLPFKELVESQPTDMFCCC